MGSRDVRSCDRKGMILYSELSEKVESNRYTLRCFFVSLLYIFPGNLACLLAYSLSTNISVIHFSKEINTYIH